jgi:hypothetical protein
MQKVGMATASNGFVMRMKARAAAKGPAARSNTDED